MKIAFIFITSREEIAQRIKLGQDADTALRGSNYLSGADNFTIASKSITALPFIPRLLRYDFVVAQDNLLLGYVVSIIAKILGKKTKWIYVAMNSSTLIRRNANRPLRLFVLKKIWSNYAKIACLSTEQLEDFVKLGISREKLIFVPFGVDANFFAAGDLSKEEDLIVSVGRDAGRDYETLFKAAQLVNHPFTIVASARNIPTLRQVPENISVLYDKSLTEIRDLYKRARIVVIVSKDSKIPEGSDCSGQTVILDALAAGKAVIATHRPWIADYFEAGKDLVVVEPHNPQVLADAINNLLNDVSKRERLARSGYDKVVAQYTTEDFAKNLLNIMNSLVQSK